jgi:sphingolipid delta-4 desaturase
MIKHPEVKSLMGKNPLSFVAILLLVAGMIGISYLVRDTSWWVVVAVAYLVGAFANHALFVLIHECTHNLLFKKKSWNLSAAIIANLPHTLPSAISFVRYHIKHHSFQGVHELDGDLPDYWEAKLINHSFLGKALWMLFFPIFQAIRTVRLKEIKPVDGWIVANWLAQIVFDVAIWMLIGPQAFVFLLLSFFFSVGLHPLGARWIQEHYLTLDEHQETYSYYGPLNKVAFNVGYHNEHHDFPSIPWNRLPDLKSKAPEYYESLKAHTSWTRLFFRFLFDKNISLYMRILRQERNKVALTDESKPDAELVMESSKSGF